jgi:FtsP/CotA-like multicopper oxidase with cupredoxin domain
MPGLGVSARGWLNDISRRWVLRKSSTTVCVVAAVCLGFAASGIISWLGATGLPSGLAQRDACVRPEPGSEISEPQELRSRDGVLELDLAIHDQKLPDGTTRYCYVTSDGKLSPTLRLKPGDQLVIRLKNDLVDYTAAKPEVDPSGAQALGSAPICTTKKTDVNPCSSGAMTPVSTNLHFHGFTAPPVCHQDDVMKTSIQPDEQPFEYRLRIPDDEPPGLYWYHPHIHGYSKTQVLGGASGAMIIEGIERADPSLAGMPERTLVIRDQDLLNPDAPPSKSEPVISKNLLDNDGDAANSGTGFGKPSKDLSVNFVPVPYPDYTPATLAMKPGQRQLWRVLNASAITYLNLALLFRNAPQPLGIVGIDGTSISFQGSPSPAVQWANHIGVPPGARVEFIVEGPPLGVPALLVTRAVDTGPAGENDPNRRLVRDQGRSQRARSASGVARAHGTSAAAVSPMARERRASPRPETVFFRTTGESERPE